MTDAFKHESAGHILGLDGQLQPVSSLAYSTLKDYVIGAAVQFGLPWRDAAVEMDALYRPMNLTNAGIRPDGTLHSISPATVVAWEFPVLARYAFGSGRVKPFLEAGPSFRASGNLNNASPSAYGATAGLGFEARAAMLRPAPFSATRTGGATAISLPRRPGGTNSNCC